MPLGTTLGRAGASVTGTPLHYFMQSQLRNTASGEALRKAETRFIAKVRDRQAAFGQVCVALHWPAVDSLANNASVRSARLAIEMPPPEVESHMEGPFGG